MSLSIIIVSWNTKDLLDKCLQSLQQELQRLPIDQVEVFVVDNASADSSAEMVRRNHPWVTLIANTNNVGFGRANNQVLRNVNTEYALLLNPDTLVLPGSITELLNFMVKHLRAGIVAPQLINSDGSIQRSCREFPSFSGMLFELLRLGRLFPNNTASRRYKMLDFDHTYMRQVDQPEGACLLVRSQAMKQVGIFDEAYFMLFEEVDWCYAFKRAGWEIWFDPTAKIVHHYGQSIKQVKIKMIMSSHKGMYYFWKKNYAGTLGKILSPLIYIMLVVLGWVRIATYSAKRVLK